MMSIHEAAEALTKMLSGYGIAIGEWAKGLERARLERARCKNRLSLTANAFGISIDEVAAIEDGCIVKHMINQEALNEIDDISLIDTIYFACLYGASCREYYEEIGNLSDKGYDLCGAMSRYRVDLANLIYGEEEKDE